MQGPGVEISLHIGQHVRHGDYKGERVTGEVRGLSLDRANVLHADITLDAPIIIPARNADDREIHIWHQTVPAHELAPFDARDELIANLMLGASLAIDWMREHGAALETMAPLQAALDKASGSAA
jgi:hypothetical protein